MKPTPQFEELVIALIAPNLNPTHFTPEFLFYSGIVPPDWQLAQPPEGDSHMTKITFTNGAIASVHNYTITFSETLESKPLKDIQIPTIVGKYVDTLPNANYQAVEINPSIFLTFEAGENSNAHYIPTALLSKGSWLEFGSTPARGTLQLAYTVGNRQLNLKIDDILLRGTNNKPEFAALFSGNFSYPIAGRTTGERLHQLHRLIDNWSDDFKIFQELVKGRFLGISAN
ncbi:MAG: hypothetical protein F6K32_11940 [Desertifilum sp. SIO1I2]|nr:hypothetical protein [Desertifilum sp. SIO1I2]